MDAVLHLCMEIKARQGLSADAFLGHSDIAPTRKEDPGELFPWAQLARDGIGQWPKPAVTTAPAAALTKFGYDPEVTDAERIRAFQRHFRPRHVSGAWDVESAGLLAGLLLPR